MSPSRPERRFPRRSLALALALASALLLDLAAQRSAVAEERATATLTLQGRGSVTAVPDMARVTSGVVSEAPTAAEALSANSAALNAVFSALRSAGVEERDMQTSDFSVQPVYTGYDPDSKEPPRIVAYRVSNAVTVRVRDLAGLGPLLDAMVAAGANAVNGISFLVSDADTRLDEARRAAVADALHKAELYTGAAGVKLGRVLTIAEGGATPPRPKYRMEAMAMADAPTPIAAGEETLEVTVTIVWELAD